MAQATTSGHGPTLTSLSAPFAERTSSESLVMALYEVVRYSRRTFDTNGLEPAAVVVLAAAARLSPARPSDLACDIRLDLSTVSRHLRNLERDGFIDRSRDPDDGRAHRVAPTEQGHEALHAVLSARGQVVDDALSHWSPSERQTLAELLRRLADDLNSASASEPRSEASRDHRKDDA